MAESDLPILLLAAGASRRMGGRDKLREPVDGMPLLRRQVLMAQAATAGPVLVTLPVAADDPHDRRAMIADLAVSCVPVPDADEGINASLRRGLAALPVGVPAVMILLADLPDLTTKDLSRVFRAVDLSCDTLVWRGATSAGAPGHPIVVHANLFPRFAKLRGDSGGKEVIGTLQDKVHLVPLEGNRARADLDTPQAWDAWHRARTARGPSRAQ